MIDEETLFALDEPECMFVVERAPNASKARYLGWRILRDVCYVETPFDPRFITAKRVLMARFTNDPFAEMTHRICGEGTPGARLYWRVMVEP